LGCGARDEVVFKKMRFRLDFLLRFVSRQNEEHKLNKSKKAQSKTFSSSTTLYFLTGKNYQEQLTTNR
jgi:hypothetical protein